MKLGRAVQVPPTNIGQNYLELGGSSVKLGSAMKMPSLSAANRPVATFFGHRRNAIRPGLLSRLRTARCCSAEKSGGFTLVEMLVVVTIIGILASLITAAAVAARRRAKIAAIVTDISQLDMALKAYKARFGEYPPDFATTGPGTSSAIMQATVLRHLAKVFPRYTPGVLGGGSGWTGFVNDVKNGWGIDPSKFSGFGPAAAITFWLGGKPIWVSGTPSSNTWKPVTGFLGFSANPLSPFGSETNRIAPFYDFDVTSICYYTSSGTSGLWYWAPGASGASPVNSSLYRPYLYMRAENGTYPQQWAGSGSVCFPFVDRRVDTGTTSTSYLNRVFVNPQSFQLLSFGFDRDCCYTTDGDYPHFPNGDNYGNKDLAGKPAAYSFDDITNFSNGTLEDAIP